MSDPVEGGAPAAAPAGDAPAGERRGFRGAGARGGPRGGDRERRPGGPGGRRPGGRGEDGWKPVTKLGRLVAKKEVTSLDEVFRLAIPIKEPQIVDELLKASNVTLKEEVVNVKPVQKQTKAGQRTRFKAYIVIGDGNGHIGLGWKCSKEVQGAIKGAIMNAKCNLVPVRRGYWGNAIGEPHTVPTRISGKCGSVRIRLIPAPRGTGLVAAPTSKKVLTFAGIRDVYTASSGKTKTPGNFAKAVYDALEKTYHYLTPNLWGKTHREETEEEEHPFNKFSKWLAEKPEDRPRPKFNRSQN